MRWSRKPKPEWKRRFAWLPVYINDGKYVWLEWYEERMIVTRDENGYNISVYDYRLFP